MAERKKRISKPPGLPSYGTIQNSIDLIFRAPYKDLSKKQLAVSNVVLFTIILNQKKKLDELQGQIKESEKPISKTTPI